MEQARMMPAAPLQYVCVMFLKRSWPAVSQICSLNLRLLTSMVLILKSTPMVATQESLKAFSQNRVMRLVLPTPLSPIIITFAIQSYLSLFFAYYIHQTIIKPIACLRKSRLQTQMKRSYSCLEKGLLFISMIKAVAIYGGAFDPPHVGHLKLIHHLGKMEGIDEVWLMPCGDRDDKKLLLPMEKRFHLMRTIFEKHPQIKVSEDEIQLSRALKRPIHTYDLLNELKKKYLETKFYFVIGGDILHSLHLWGNADKLVQENAFIVFYRKGYELLPDKMPIESKVVEVDLPEISSSAIKAVVASHGKTREEKLHELKDWVSEEVITLLLQEKLI